MIATIIACSLIVGVGFVGVGVCFVWFGECGGVTTYVIVVWVWIRATVSGFGFCLWLYVCFLYGVLGCVFLYLVVSCCSGCFVVWIANLLVGDD